ncbi:RagB/SusD family nutrient uptake outer membrane protein [Mucilaginibacter lappiensis]|uniref:RagB/SusD domain-containing protein n=1 Tax=Mucilaginibacter lappiensis TaxID=354630 RepID=A0A841JSK2_9SPHI|nr:RagB/SusD family nutrient uptake outer membrane protein [Mucilaginibacter lappiensis]MBB6130821.1 hypothetical protein [Mucilaginibacter lappiensis]
MSKHIQKTLIGCLAVATLVFSACEKTVDINAPLSQTSSASVFSSDRLAATALSGMYGSLSQTTTQTLNLTLYSSLQADDLTYGGTVILFSEMAANTYSALSTGQSTPFSEWYAVIYRANSIIEGLQKYSGTSDKVKVQYTAEAKFIRAYCYFNLVNTFGDVPLVLATDVNVTAYQPRESTANVYKQIVADLLDAKANLLTDYSGSGGNREGANKFVAAALLARVSMFTGDYATAESNASEVIASSLYSIIPPASMGAGVFVRNSTEAIWQMSAYLNTTNQYTNEGATLLPNTLTGLVNYPINTNLLQVFDNTDFRRTRWIRDVNSTVSVANKYKYANNNLAVAAGVTEYQVVLRLAEQYLIRAEARARMGTNITGALSDMNVIRNRANLASSTTTNPTALLAEIALENRREFFAEQGLRWYTLKRTNQADAVLGALKPTTWTPKAKLLPIPQTAIDANPNLTQNPGY